jgi:hypothetical protein
MSRCCKTRSIKRKAPERATRGHGGVSFERGWMLWLEDPCATTVAPSWNAPKDAEMQTQANLTDLPRE